MENNGEIILYQPDSEVKLEVRIEDETVGLNRQQLSELFNRDVKTIGKHVNNALKEELAGMATVAKFATVAIPANSSFSALLICLPIVLTSRLNNSEISSNIASAEASSPRKKQHFAALMPVSI